MKGIKKIELVDKKSSKGKEYSVIEVTMSNDKSFDLFLDSATKDLIDVVGKEDVNLNYVEKESKEGKKFNAIELKLNSDDNYTKLYFIDKAYELIIKKLSEKVAIK